MERINQSAFEDIINGKTFIVTVEATHKKCDELKVWLKENRYLHGSIPITENLTLVTIQVSLSPDNIKLVNRLNEIYNVVG